MADFSAGSAYISIIPDLSGAAAAIRAKLKQEVGQGIDVAVTPTVDQSAARAAGVSAAAAVREGLGSGANITIGADTTGFDVKYRQIVASIAELRSQKIEPQASLDISKLEVQAAQVTQRLAELGRQRANVQVDVQIDKAERQIDALEARIAQWRAEGDKPGVARFDIDQAMAAIDRLRAHQAELRDTQTRADIDIAAGMVKLDQIQAKLNDFGASKANASADLNTISLDEKIAEARASLDQLGQKSVTATAQLDKAKLEADLLSVIAKLDDLNGKTATAHTDADTAQAKVKLDELTAKLDEFGAKSVSAKADVDTSSGVSKLGVLTAALTGLAGPIGGAVAGLGALGAAGVVGAAGLGAVVLGSKDIGKALQDQQAAQKDTTTASGQSAAQQVSHANSVANAQSAVAKAAQNVGDVQRTSAESVTKAEDAVAKAVANVGTVERSTANSIVSAREAVAKAIDNVGTVERSTANAVVSAQEAVAKAVDNVGAVERSTANTIISAREAVANAVAAEATAQTTAADNDRQALQQLTRAEETLQQAEESELRAQQNLTDARQSAQRSIEDLANRVVDDQLAQRKATDDLAKSQLALQQVMSNPAASAAQREDAQLTFAEAQQHLKEIGLSYQRSQVDSAAAARAGVDGSKQVVSAQDSLLSAQRQVHDSQTGLADAQQNITKVQLAGAAQIQKAQQAVGDAQRAQTQAELNGADQVAKAHQAVADAQRALSQAELNGADQVAKAQQAVGDAQRALTQAELNGADQVAKAHQAVADAQRALSDAQINGAAQVAKAQEAVVAAQRALNEAQQQGTSETGKQSAAAKTLAEDLAKLSPPARAFYDQIRALTPEFDNLKRAAQTGVLPGMSAALTDLNSRAGEVTQTVGRLGIGMGGFFSTLGAGLTSPYWSSFFNTISDAGITLMPRFATTLLDVGRGVGDLVQALLPAAPAALGLVSDLGSLLSALSPVVGTISGPLIGSLRQFVDMLKADLGPAIQALSPIVVDISSVFTNSLGGALQIVRAGLDAAAPLVHLLADALNALPPPLEALAVSAGLLALGPGSKLLSFFGKLNPETLAAGSALTGLRGGFDKAGAASSGFVQKMAGSGVASTAAAGGFQAAGRGLSVLGSALPTLVIGFTALVAIAQAGSTSMDEATASLEKGGAAARETTDAIKAQNSTPPVGKNWIGDLNEAMKGELGLSTSVDDAKAALEKQRSEMTLLGAAQSRATEAQGNYDDAVRQFGTNSPAAIAAQHNLADATNKVKIAQDAQALATENATQKLQDQQNKILAATNASLAARQSAEQLAQAQRGLGDAISQHGRDSLEAKAAQDQLEQAQTSYVQSTVAAAEQEAKRKGVTDTSAASTRAYNDAVLKLAGDTQGPLSQSLNDMISHMSVADLTSEGARVKVDNFGHAVATLPSGREIKIDVDTLPATQRLQQTIDVINAAVGHLTIDANGQPANAESRRLLDNINASIGTLKIAGDPGPGNGSLRDLLARVDAARQAMHIEGDPKPATNDTNQLLQWVGRQESAIQAKANTDPAQKDVNTFRGGVVGAPPAPIPMGANFDAAKQDTGGFWGWLGNFFSNRSATLFGKLSGNDPAPPPPPPPPGHAAGGLVTGLAAGGPVGSVGAARGAAPLASSDTVPAMLTPGEVVFSKPAVDKVGAPALLALHTALSGGSIPAGTGPVGMAEGGIVPTLTSGAPAAGATPSAAPAAVPGAAAAAASTTAAAGGASALTASVDALVPKLAALVALITAQLRPKLAEIATTALPTLAAGFTANAATVADTQTRVAAAVLGAVGAQEAQWVGVETTALPALTGAHQAHQAVVTAVWNTTAAVTAGSVAAQNAQMGVLQGGLAVTGGAQIGLQVTQTGQWAIATGSVGGNVAVQQGHMAALQTGMAVTGGAQIGLQATQTGQWGIATGAVAANVAGQNAQMAGLQGGMAATGGAQIALQATQTGQWNLATGNVAAAVAGQNAQMVTLQNGMVATGQAGGALGALTGQQWTGMAGAVTTNTAAILGQFGALQNGMNVAGQATLGFARFWHDQMDTLGPSAGNPIRWVMQQPFAAGIDAAWNGLDAQFQLGKHVNPVLPGFAEGGQVDGPGTGVSDDVVIRASAGEWIVKEKVARDHGSFLSALNSGQAEAVQAAQSLGHAGPGQFVADLDSGNVRAVQAAGGRRASMPGFAAGGPVPPMPPPPSVVNALNFARSMQGKPYIWGGPDPSVGTDCSGFQGMVTNVLRNQAPARIGTTGTMPWGGFIPGLTSSYTIGNHKDPGGHMAGTLTGINLESGSGHGPMVGGIALGSTSSYFGEHYSLPEVGGQFVDGGPGGGGIDVGAIIDDAFRHTYELIDQIPQQAHGDVGLRLQGQTRQGADAVKGQALDKLSAMFAGPIGGGAAPAGLINDWIMQALGILHWPGNYAAGIFQQIMLESSGNPGAIQGNIGDVNNASGDLAKGIMQVIGTTFAANALPGHTNVFNPVDNIIAGSRYAMNKFGAGWFNPGPQHSHGYDSGGYLPTGVSVVHNNTGSPEPVLTGAQWDALTQGVRGGDQQRREVNVNFHDTIIRDPVDVDMIAGRLDFADRAAAF